MGKEIWLRSLREFINKIKNGKAAGVVVVVSEMIKSTGLAGVDIITAEWKLSTIVRCYNDKGDVLDRRNCKVLELRDYILKVTAKCRYE